MMGVLITGVNKGMIWKSSGSKPNTIPINEAYNDEGTQSLPSNQLIRFHVLANSDSDQDQALKRAVRDAILKEVSPKLAASHSLEESRQILQSVRFEMEDIGRAVVKAWGKDYTVHTEYGHFSFPTKSYGTLILPAGDYEALRVVIGEGKGSNWWCVLFPPLCFIDIEHSTAVQVDGKPGIPIDNTAPVYPVQQRSEQTGENLGINRSMDLAETKTTNPTISSPKVRFYFWDLVSRLFN
ncbi:stage II sporulation protein R [Desulfosporosinus sp. SB140]|uniref:stage II sporulation protein R n=1 Tax=Desulfosporosinus paludis TaxID=3115649 RepID=UPI00388E2F45